jgi:predicted TIM-barrel fold metal-dependent hydrolase
MWGSDFAHAASDFPNSQKCLAEAFEGVPENERRAMLVDNCVRFFHLDK